MARSFELHDKVAKLLVRLLADPATYEELAEASGLSESTVRLWVGALRRVQHPIARDPRVKVVRVAGYCARQGPRGGTHEMEFEFNDNLQRNATKPPPMSGAERARRGRMRKRIARLSSALHSPLTAPQCQHTDTVANEGA